MIDFNAGFSMKRRGRILKVGTRFYFRIWCKKLSITFIHDSDPLTRDGIFRLIFKLSKNVIDIQGIEYSEPLILAGARFPVLDDSIFDHIDWILAAYKEEK